MKKLIIISSLCLGFAVHIAAQKVDSTKSIRITLKASNPSTFVDPLIIIDGNKQFIKGKSAISGLDPNSIESVTVLKDSSAKALYGEDGSAGVILIKTKAGKGSVETSIPSTIPGSKIEGKDAVISLKKEGSSILVTDDSKYLSLKPSKNRSNLLYIIDGKEAEDFDIKKLNPEEIESINIIKDAASKSLYGEKGNDGIIIIKTKKARFIPKKN